MRPAMVQLHGQPTDSPVLLYEGHLELTRNARDPSRDDDRQRHSATLSICVLSTYTALHMLNCCLTGLLLDSYSGLEKNLHATMAAHRVRRTCVLIRRSLHMEYTV